MQFSLIKWWLEYGTLQIVFLHGENIANRELDKSQWTQVDRKTRLTSKFKEKQTFLDNYILGNDELIKSSKTVRKNCVQ